MPDPNRRALTALRRLRRVETDAARRDLGEAIAQETEIMTREAAMREELDAARRMTGDFDREAFSAWLRRTRAERTWLADALKDAAARTAASRTALAQRRVAETAAEEALASEVAARQAETARRDQVALEDVARALKRAAEE
jgi:hypothetical protein